jgi:predicted ATPase
LPADVPLGSTLAELRRLNLLLETATGVEPNVTFRHALTQQVAYEDIPFERRRELHAAAATAIEQAYAHRLGSAGR